MAKILVIGLNPAWQTILEFPQFRQGEVNRATTATHLASGKGMNTAKVLRKLGHEVWLLQVLGGQNGQRCQGDCDSLGIHSLVAWVKAETRQCLTLLDHLQNQTTEMIEPFQVQEMHLEHHLLNLLPPSPDFFEAVVISGSLPSGLPEKIYSDILSQYQAAVKVVDSCQGLNVEMVQQITCLKINALELGGLEADLGNGSCGLSHLGQAWLAITDGPGKAYLKHQGRLRAEFIPPNLSNPLNAIGAGDTVTAGLTHGLLSGLDMQESFRRGLALGSASCLNLKPAEYAEPDFQRVLPQVVQIAV